MKKTTNNRKLLALAFAIGTAGLLSACTEADYKKVNEELKLAMAKAVNEANDKSGDIQPTAEKEQNLPPAEDKTKQNQPSNIEEPPAPGRITPPDTQDNDPNASHEDQSDPVTVPEEDKGKEKDKEKVETAPQNPPQDPAPPGGTQGGTPPNTVSAEETHTDEEGSGGDKEKGDLSRSPEHTSELTNVGHDESSLGVTLANNEPPKTTTPTGKATTTKELTPEEKKALEAALAKQKAIQSESQQTVGSLYADVQAVSSLSVLSQATTFFNSVAEFTPSSGFSGVVDFGYTDGKFKSEKYTLKDLPKPATEDKKPDTSGDSNVSGDGTTNNETTENKDPNEVGDTTTTTDTSTTTNTSPIPGAGAGGGAGGEGSGSGSGTDLTPDPTSLTLSSSNPSEDENPDETTTEATTTKQAVSVSTKGSVQETQGFIGLKTTINDINYAVGLGLIHGKVKVGSTYGSENVANGTYSAESLFLSAGKGFGEYYANVGLFFTKVDHNYNRAGLAVVHNAKFTSKYMGLNLSGGYKVYAQDNHLVTTDASFNLVKYLNSSFTEKALSSNGQAVTADQTAEFLSFTKKNGYLGSLTIGANYKYLYGLNSFSARLEGSYMFTGNGFKMQIADSNQSYKALPSNFTAKLILGYALEISPGISVKLSGSASAGAVNAFGLGAGLAVKF